MLLRGLIFLHRWIGIAICVVFLIWFPSGIGMMYWTFPSVSAADRLERAPALDAATVRLSPAEAAAVLAMEDAAPAQIRLNTFDGRPAYRIGGGGRGGRGGGGRIVYADTGETQGEVSTMMRHRIAGAWTGRPAAEAAVTEVTEVDQWTVGGALRNVRPAYKYSWPTGEQLYMNGNTGEVMQYTTTASRIAAHVSAIPHWVYYTPIRKHQPVWIRFMIWTAGIGTVGAIVGVIVGVWMYSPKKRYRNNGQPTAIPYRGQKRWHTIIGLVFGIATITYAFSGMMSLDPFPQLDRRQAPAGGRRAPSVAQGLRGRVSLDDFAASHPRDVIAKHPDLRIKELELTSFDSEPLYGATLADGTTMMLRLDGTPVPWFGDKAIGEIVRKAAPDPAAVELTTLEQYDLYYLDRRRERPLPVLLARMHDEEKTRYYIDPKTARVVGQYSNRNWVGRWLYTGLHSLNFPWLYNYRPLWDIVVITLMVGGTALCVTSLVLAWRVLGRKLARVATATDVLAS